MKVYGIKNCKNPTERRVAEWIKNINTSKMKHKLSFAICNVPIQVHDGPDRECDVLLVGESGILTLEVKGGEFSIKEGEWYVYNKPLEQDEKENPFIQVSNIYFSLKKILEKEGIPQAGYYAVVFADLKLYKPIDRKYPMELHLDSRLANYAEESIDAIFDYSIKKFGNQKLNQKNIEKIRSLLVPDYNNYISDYTSSIDEQVIMLSEEQKVILENLKTNKRIIISGPPGSGKTILAIEQLIINERECIETLYICFNRALKNMVIAVLRSKLGRDPNYVKVETTTSIAKFKTKRFEFIVADETQDYLDDDSLNRVFDLLEGDILKGKFRIFIDQRQNFRSNLDHQYYDELTSRDDVVLFTLSKNYRNTKFIGVCTLSLQDETIGDLTNNPEGEVPTFLSIPYGYGVPDWEEYTELFCETVNNLLDNGFEPIDIMIVSTNSKKKSLIHKNINSIKIKNGVNLIHIRDYDWINPSKNVIKYGSVYETKGIDSKIVILTDVFNVDSSTELLVGMTRARSKIIIFFGSKYQKIIENNKLLKGINEYSKSLH